MSCREWNSEAYNRLSDPQHGWGVKVVERIRARGDEFVLDAGCGTGRVTAELAEAFPNMRIVGGDLSENMLETARANLKPRFGERLSLVCMNLLNLPFSRAFDGVFSTAAFHWVTDHERLFRNLFGVLKPGAWLTAQCGGGPNLKRVRDRARALQATPAWAEFFERWTEPWMYADDVTTTKRLLEAGFVEVRTWLEPADLELRSRQEYREFIATVVFRLQLARITDAKGRELFLDEMVEQAEREHKWLLDYWRLNIEAKVP